jgi:hypothetical protein
MPVGDHREAPNVDFGLRQQCVSVQLLSLTRRLVAGFDAEVRQPARRRAAFPFSLLAHTAIAAAGVDDRDVAAVVGLVLPAEQLTEERLGPLDVGGRELVPAQSADIVDECGADQRPRLPERDDGAGRIADRGHPAGVEHIEGRAEDRRAAQLAG